MAMPVTVLRLGHRPERDKRVTTHCALVARAFGAREIVYSGERDDKFEDSVRKVAASWGGPFAVRYESNWRNFIRKFRGTKVHLTMYGLPFDSVPAPRGNVLVIVGAEKVPGEVYGMADQNLCVGSQPHSEIAALAVYLYRLNGIKKKFSKAKLRIVPMERGKKVIDANKRPSLRKA
jgi:tRNA (cytidine56-2'-O)-methyltransferase